jgi:predicted amidohydrolase
MQDFLFFKNKNDYDVVLYVANWPETRVLAWETLTKARAIENQLMFLRLIELELMAISSNMRK